MKFENHSLLISTDALLDEKMKFFRGERVLLDADAAEILDINIQQLHRKVRENIERFPEQFMFVLSKNEMAELFLQGTKRKKIVAFTWGGLMMLAGLVNTKRAIEIHLQLIRCYGKGIFDMLK